MSLPVVFNDFKKDCKIKKATMDFSRKENKFLIYIYCLEKDINVKKEKKKTNNENHVLKPIHPAVPVSKEQKIEGFAHKFVTQQWLNASEQAKAFNRGETSTDLEKKIDEIIKNSKN